MNAAPLLEVRDLTIVLGGPSQRLEAVSCVSFSLAEGRTLGIVGESGCGKSITMLALMGLLPGHVEITGSVRFRGEELLGRPQGELSRLRGKRMAMIFQDPMTSLNPVMTVAGHIEEAISIHDRGMSAAARRDRALALLKTVAIPLPERRLGQYPHELSGGMRQRVMIAVAMANDPDLLIADEPTTALDVTVQAQIMELLQELQAERKMGLVLISHDLGVVAGVAHDVAVMYAGRICEHGPVDAVFERPSHPYTGGLLASLPQIDGTVDNLTAIPGSLPSLAARPVGCRFHPRCTLAQPVCTENDPQLLPRGTVAVACHFAEKVAAR